MQDAVVDIGEESFERPGAGHRAVDRGRGVPWWDVGISAGLASLTLLVHDVGYVLHAPYWNDEVWVAVSTKVPLSDVPAAIASSPIGWDLLLRLAPAGHPQAGRLIPLAFAAATVVAAYWLVRTLPWETGAARRVAAASAGAITLVMPSALMRNDLKQYTCDAFCVLVLIGLTAHAERAGSRRALATLVLAGGGLFLFANPAALALGAGLVGLGCVALARRDWRSVRRIVLAGCAALALLLAIYVAFYARGNVGGLRTYWATNFPPLAAGPTALWPWFWGVAPGWFRVVGIGPVYVALPLLAVGAIRIGRAGLPATGLMVPMLFAELVVLACLKQYPIFDARTSHFLAVPVAVVGVVGAVAVLLRCRPAPVAPVIALLAVAAATIWHGSSARQHNVPIQTTRQDVQTIKDGWRREDVIVTNTNGSWALAYYWGGDVRITPTSNTQQKFRAESVEQPSTHYVCPQADYKAVPPTSCFAPETTSAALERVSGLTRGRSRMWVDLLQGTRGVKEAVMTWAAEHDYAWRRPTRLPGSYLYLLTPCGPDGVDPDEPAACAPPR